MDVLKEGDGVIFCAFVAGIAIAVGLVTFWVTLYAIYTVGHLLGIWHWAP